MLITEIYAPFLRLTMSLLQGLLQEFHTECRRLSHSASLFVLCALQSEQLVIQWVDLKIGLD